MGCVNKKNNYAEAPKKLPKEVSEVEEILKKTWEMIIDKSFLKNNVSFSAGLMEVALFCAQSSF